MPYQDTKPRPQVPANDQRDYHTFTEWQTLGYRILKGSKARYSNARGTPVFHTSQVAVTKKQEARQLNGETEDMPAKLPVAAAKMVGKKYECDQVIVAAWDGEATHIVSWGLTTEDCAQAAQGANKIKDALGWPADLRAEPPRVRTLLDRIKALENEVAQAKALARTW